MALTPFKGSNQASTQSQSSNLKVENLATHGTEANVTVSRDFAAGIQDASKQIVGSFNKGVDRGHQAAMQEDRQNAATAIRDEEKAYAKEKEIENDGRRAEAAATLVEFEELRKSGTPSQVQGWRNYLQTKHGSKVLANVEQYFKGSLKEFNNIDQQIANRMYREGEQLRLTEGNEAAANLQGQISSNLYQAAKDEYDKGQLDMVATNLKNDKAKQDLKGTAELLEQRQTAADDLHRKALYDVGVNGSKNAKNIKEYQKSIQEDIMTNEHSLVNHYANSNNKVSTIETLKNASLEQKKIFMDMGPNFAQANNVSLRIGLESGGRGEIFYEKIVSTYFPKNGRDDNHSLPAYKQMMATTNMVDAERKYRDFMNKGGKHDPHAAMGFTAGFLHKQRSAAETPSHQAYRKASIDFHSKDYAMYLQTGERQEVLKNFSPEERDQLRREEIQAQKPQGEPRKAPGGFKITSGYGPRPVVTGSRRNIKGATENNTGVDYVTDSMQALAPAPGKVINGSGSNAEGFQKGSKSLGNWIQVQTEDGNSYVIAHLNKFDMENMKGKSIQEGELLAMANKGSGSGTGPHMKIYALEGTDFNLKTRKTMDPTRLLVGYSEKEQKVLGDAASKVSEDITSSINKKQSSVDVKELMDKPSKEVIGSLRGSMKKIGGKNKKFQEDRDLRRKLEKEGKITNLMNENEVNRLIREYKAK